MPSRRGGFRRARRARVRSSARPSVGSLRCEPARAPPERCPQPALPSSVRALSYSDTVNSERVYGTGGGPPARPGLARARPGARGGRARAIVVSAEPAARAAAKAERSGEAVLQPVPRRLLRWGLRRHLRQRRWFAEIASPLPAPALTSVLLTPLAPVFVWQAGASDEHVRRDLAGLPGLLDEVDGLLERGVIGGRRSSAPPTSRSAPRFGCCSRWRTSASWWRVGRHRPSRFGSCPTTPTCLPPYPRHGYLPQPD